jgi:eukaryotic-like serine/threonine-protein kinase
MTDDSMPERVGNYKLVKRIAKGGMGEVFEAYDPICRRRVALKRIRKDLDNQEVLYQRFLREAWVTAQLTHPSVVPIYNIHDDFYTMPYVEGRTLKQILKEARTEKREENSIQSLITILLDVCQAVAYAHHRGVIHRDLKPENIMVGAYGEAYILDWGLAKWIEEPEIEDEEEEATDISLPDVTVAGKLFGTVSYMAPERAFGHPATVQSDIYALGVILYEILCLHQPFQRVSIKKFRETAKEERLVHPAEIAPYRNVPRLLARMAQKCLRPRMADRYQTVDDLIHELQNYMQGRSEWFRIATLHPEKTEDWEFQENIYMADNVALTGGEGGTEWVSMMVSRDSFPGNTRLVSTVTIGDEGTGVGLLMNVPERSEREELNSGYYLWLGSDKAPGTKLFRSSVQVAELSTLDLKRGRPYTVRLERIDNSLRLFIDDQLKLSYLSHLPLLGTHVGLLLRDADVTVDHLDVLVGSYSIKVNCLALPDAFLAEGHYDKALSEYRRIAYSFPERDEGREAQFRAGITLLEQKHFNAALREFDKLHATAGAPLEYLGKALVYRKQGEIDEEAKCFELAFRKYSGHPLMVTLEEQVVHLLHQLSRRDRLAAYRFMLLVAQHMPDRWKEPEIHQLASQLERHWEPLPFFQPIGEARDQFATRLAFWLARPLTLEELSPASPENATFALFELGAYRLAAKLVEEHHLTHLEPLAACHQQNLTAAMEILSPSATPRLYLHLADHALSTNQTALVHLLAERLDDPRRLASHQIWAYLLAGDPDSAGQILEEHPLEELHQDTSLLHTLYGCYLAATEGQEIALAHFSAALDTPFPRTWGLLGHHLTGKISTDGPWGTQSFLFERRALYRQLHLYHTCLGQTAQAQHFKRLAEQQALNA